VFDSIKKMFCTKPILKVYDPELPTRVECDASGFATGGILSQKHKDGLWHPVAYCSQSMSKEECNYEIYNQEMLGLICALEDWRHFLEGISFEVITDHKNMEMVDNHARPKSTTGLLGPLPKSVQLQGYIQEGRIHAGRCIKQVCQRPGAR